MAAKPTVTYTVRRSRRAKYVRLSVAPGGAVVLTAPIAAPQHALDAFVQTHAEWIHQAIARMTRFTALPVSGRRDYVKHKEEARTFVRERVEHWNQFYAYSYNRIAIKNTKRTWGSCSRRGNLNFSYKLLFLPRELSDYVVVHELCHLKEHNHGAAFWHLVAQTIPDYAARRRSLKRYLLRA